MSPTCHFTVCLLFLLVGTEVEATSCSFKEGSDKAGATLWCSMTGAAYVQITPHFSSTKATILVCPLPDGCNDTNIIFRIDYANFDGPWSALTVDYNFLGSQDQSSVRVDIGNPNVTYGECVIGANRYSKPRCANRSLVSWAATDTQVTSLSISKPAWREVNFFQAILEAVTENEVQFVMSLVPNSEQAVVNLMNAEDSMLHTLESACQGSSTTSLPNSNWCASTGNAGNLQFKLPSGNSSFSPLDVIFNATAGNAKTTLGHLKRFYPEALHFIESSLAVGTPLFQIKAALAMRMPWLAVSGRGVFGCFGCKFTFFVGASLLVFFVWELFVRGAAATWEAAMRAAFAEEGIAGALGGRIFNAAVIAEPMLRKFADFLTTKWGKFLTTSARFAFFGSGPAAIAAWFCGNVLSYCSPSQAISESAMPASPSNLTQIVV